MKNTKLAKVGNTSLNSSTVSNSGHSQSCVVVPATALANPGRYDGTPGWFRKNAQYQESVQQIIKYGQDF